MRRHNESWIIKAILFRIVSFAVFSYVVMLLWNNIVVSLFGFKAIGYFQSLGLLVLVRLLTGNFGNRGHWAPSGMMQRKRFMYDRWKHMTEEQKKEMLQRMKKGICSVDFEEKKD